MGVDIHMSIISKRGEYKYHDIFDGRDTEWFDNITGNYYNEAYQHFPIMNSLPEIVPDKIKENFEKAADYGYYNFFHVNIGEFIEWFMEARPDIDAGWLSTYEKWLYEKKHIIPQTLPHELDEECNPYDYNFVEVENIYEGSRWLYEFITEHSDITAEDFIVYYFDC